VLVLTCAVRLLRDRPRLLTPAAAIVLGAPVVGFALSAATSLDPGAGLAGFLRYVQVFVLVPASIVLLLRDRRDFTVLAGSIVISWPSTRSPTTTERTSPRSATTK